MIKLESLITTRSRHPIALVRKHYIWLCVLIAAVMYLVRLPSFQVGTYYDDALYITLAKSISSGLEFKRIELVGAPETTFVPFGYPLLLAPLVLFFPHTYTPMQLMSVAFALGNILLVWIFLKRRVAPLLTALVLLLFAFNDGAVGLASMVMSETAFIFFSMLALVLLDQYEADRNVITWNWMGLALTASMAYLVRVPGLALIGGILIYLLLRRRLGKAIAFGVPIALILGAWFYRNWTVSGVLISKEYIEQGTRSSVIDYLPQIQATVKGYFSLLPNSLVPLLSPKTTDFLNAINPWLPILFGAVIWGMVIAGCFYSLRHNVGAPDLYVGLMIVLLSVWGREQERYLVPLLPFLYLYMILGINLVSRWALSLIRTSIRPAQVMTICAAGILLLNVARNVQEITNPVRQRIPDISLGAIWIREHSPTHAVVMARVPRSTFLYSERSVVPYPPDEDMALDVDGRYFYDNLPRLTPRGMLNWAIETFRVDYVLISPPLQASTGPLIPQLDSYMQTVVLPGIENQPDRFRLVYDNRAQQVFVYEVQR